MASPFMLVRTLTFAIAVGSLTLASCKTDPPAPLKVDGATALADGGKTGPVNELPLPKDIVNKWINPNNLPEYKGPVGVVEGTIYVKGDPAPPTMGKNFDACPAASDMYSKAFREGPTLPNGTRVLADTVVGVTGYAGFIVAEKDPAEKMTISNCAYGARTVAMTYGQVLEVKNENAGPLFAPDFENQTAPAVMLAPPGGDPVKLYAKKPGRYRLIDRVGHAYLEADVIVSVTPLHAVSDVLGHYRIEGVPVGKMKVSAWHPSIARNAELEVDVHDGSVSTVDLTILNDKPAVRPPPMNTKQVIPEPR